MRTYSIAHTAHTDFLTFTMPFSALYPETKRQRAETVEINDRAQFPVFQDKGIAHKYEENLDMPAPKQ